MQAIVTKYLEPSNAKGSRVSARMTDDLVWRTAQVIIEWDSALSADRNHIAAARALLRKLGWEGVCVGAVGPDGGRVFVPRSSSLTFRVRRNVAKARGNA